MTTKLIHRNGIFACYVMWAVAIGPNSRKTRVGTCADAKRGIGYFYNPDNAANHSFVAIDTGPQ